jgi:hypothetical protein
MRYINQTGLIMERWQVEALAKHFLREFDQPRFPKPVMDEISRYAARMEQLGHPYEAIQSIRESLQ